MREPRYKDRNPAQYLGVILKGVAMGAADVIPGVSGGTMAFILGIYEELINSIKEIASVNTIKEVFKFRILKLINDLPWMFLATLGFGILLSIFSLAKILKWILENHPSLIWAFFFGLVLASIFTVMKRIKKWGTAPVIGMILGAVGAYFLVGMLPSQTPETWWFVVISGAIAICAMILPGISGSFILLLMGKYQYILGAVTKHDFLTLFWFACGAAVGIVTFAQFLSWLFRHFHDITVAILIGFMAGSLRKIWPWKDVLSTYIDRHGKVKALEEANIIPDSFDSMVIYAILLAIAGFIIVFILESLANRIEKKIEEEKEEA